MLNTFPSNASASGSSAGASTQVPTVLNGSNSTAERRDGMESFFGDTAGNRKRFGNRFEWAIESLNELVYTPIFTLTGPGVIDFLAVWRENSTTNNDYSFRVVIDGVVVLEIAPGWEASTDATEGYAVIGDFLWDNVGFTPEHGGLVFEEVNFLTSLSVECKADVASISDDIAAIYRWRKL